MPYAAAVDGAALDLGDVCGRASAIIDEVHSTGSLEVGEHLVDALPTVARSVELLRSAVTLAHGDAPAALGLIARALYEEWLWVSLWVEGTDGDRSLLRGDHQLEAERLADALGTKPSPRPEGVEPKKWSVWRRAKRLDELLDVPVAVERYQVLFQVESFASTHGGIGARGRHLRIVDDQPIIDGDAHDPRVTVGRLAVAVILVGEMCARVWAVAGRDTARFVLAAGIPFG